MVCGMCIQNTICLCLSFCLFTFIRFKYHSVPCVQRVGNAFGNSLISLCCQAYHIPVGPSLHPTVEGFPSGS